MALDQTQYSGVGLGASDRARGLGWPAGCAILCNNSYSPPLAIFARETTWKARGVGDLQAASSSTSNGGRSDKRSRERCGKDRR